MPKRVVRNTIVNTTLSTHVDEQNYKHPPLPALPRLGFADHIALQLGLALITWSRRPRTAVPAPTRQRDERLVRRNELARAERERHWVLLLQLGQPRR
jgi:hypothetical protein